MDIIQNLLLGLQTALDFQNILVALFGGIMGIIVGAMPGIGAVAGVSLLLPLTFKMNPTTAIIMLAAIYYGNMYGGAYSAILLNIPGDSPAVMTAMDGYPLSKKGKAGKALFTANFASFIGGTIGIIILTLLGPSLASVGLAFGPAEITSLILLALTSIGWLLGENPTKGLIATGIGILISTVGVDAAFGQPRFTFGTLNLLSGISFIPLVIGMFGFSQIMGQFGKKQGDEIKQYEGKKISLKESLLNKSEYKEVTGPAVRGGILGTFVGVLPGAGATTASFLSYILEKKIGKKKNQMGEGVIQGVAAAESANNGGSSGAFAPLLALGIPGSGTAAILLGGLMMWGLRPGPLLFTEEPEFVWGLISSMYVGNILCVIVGMLCIPFLIKILKVSTAVLNPIIAVICVVGSYSVQNSMFDVGIMLVAGVIAHIFNQYDYPIAPLLLAFVLAPTLELSSRQSFELSNGSPLIFIQKPISLVLLLTTCGFMITPVVVNMIKKRRKKVADA